MSAQSTNLFRLSKLIEIHASGKPNLNRSVHCLIVDVLE